MKESKRDEVKMNKKIKLYLSYSVVLVVGMFSEMVLGFEEVNAPFVTTELGADVLKQKWQIKGAGSFYLENHSVPTSKREQTDVDFNEFHFSTVVPLQTDMSLSFHPELTRNNRDMAVTKNNDFQVRFRSAAMNRRIAGMDLILSAGLLDTNLNAVYFDQYQSKRWMSAQLRPLVERYRLISDSDLGIRMAYQADEISVDVSYTNGEGQGPEAGARKSTQFRFDWAPTHFFHAGGFYLVGGDETYANEISKIEVYEIYARSDYHLLSVSGNYVRTLHPADRLTTNKSWSTIDLLAYANKSVSGSAFEFEAAYELGRLLPFYRYMIAEPVDGDINYSFLQHFFGVAYDLGPNENLGFYNYRIHFNEQHSLQAKDQDGMGVSYAMFF